MGVVAGGGPGGVDLPSFVVGIGVDRLMHLVRSSIAPSTWSSHGKVWGEWLALAGSRDVHSSDDASLAVTVEYFLRLQDLGVSTAVAQCRLTGVSYHFKLYCWTDVSKLFLVCGLEEAVCGPGVQASCVLHPSSASP